MSCDIYQKRESGDLDEVSFQRHLRVCAECQQRLQQDEELLKLAEQLERPMPSPHLWDRIEASLHEEAATQPVSAAQTPLSSAAQSTSLPMPQDSAPTQHTHARAWIYRIAAVLVVSIGLGSGYIHLQAPVQTDVTVSLYSPAALEKVRDRERQYVAAIEELEQMADVQFDEMELDLMLLYRDKIQTIDTQIARCLEALHNNPANTHIRRYLLLALQDKRETLQEIVQLEL
ncbi:MAG: hypothetical protein HOM68_02225 [Gemmatimonadetes bacterium]|jgi:hypothetical protein|nr:hypothetical protein [Gemmatimonadota bacterium]MBT4611816.1 hypothetical protein [Gemmatimonadota bacterium]MBT5055332.1 hypothetical protein [Gemmatimonadota bacterium]MBT5142799.1 hypothetical protein [Gemmatimonadota bacterium]MBT5589391.1 hypothetical protein [Gemmatimonadota bacterium]